MFLFRVFYYCYVFFNLFFCQTGLHWAAKRGREDIVKLLAKTGIDVNVKTVCKHCRNKNEFTEAGALVSRVLVAICYQKVHTFCIVSPTLKLSEDKRIAIFFSRRLTLAFFYYCHWMPGLLQHVSIVCLLICLFT